MNKELYNDRIIFIGECIDNNDPMGLGRIRAVLKTENTLDREKSVSESIGVVEKWSSKDPFVVRPLLPLFINTSPKETEFVHLIYSNSDDKSNKDKFYISGVFSSLTNINQEPYDSAVSQSNLGSRNISPKKLRNPETGEEFNKNNQGVYSLPEDISIDGRGSADIIVKNDSVILRAGKYNGTPTPNVYPIGNDSRSFLQLSKFNKKTLYGEPEQLYKFNYKHKPIKMLVEYNVINPDNNSNAYTGGIYLYNLKPSERTGTQSFGLVSNVESEKTLFSKFDFVGITTNELSSLVSTIVRSLSEEVIPDLSNITTSVTPIGPIRLSGGTRQVFPYYFRPQRSLYDKLNSDTSQTNERLFVANLMGGIKVIDSDLTGGYGLVYDQSKRGDVPFTPEKNVIIPETEVVLNNTASILGGDYVYLLSHKSNKSSTGKINLSDTLYGIEEYVLSDEIEPKTSSTVRGEELIELLNLVVQFVIGHVHPYHGMSPDSTSVNGVTADKLLEELRNANEKILNRYIRIN
tara:strand:+ start:8183 stop:9739 length:1557 start_codon:yes stop_codon:yes gene_type:complete